MLFQKKKKEISEDSKSKISGLKMVVSVTLETDESYSNRKVSEISFTKALHSTTDTPLKEIMKEFGGHIESVYTGAEEDVKNSRHLSDGYHKLSESEKRERDEE